MWRKTIEHGFFVLHSDKNGFWPIRESAGAYLCYKHFLKLFMSWIVSSNHQWMAAGASGRHGLHAESRVEQGTGYVLAHAQIRCQNGMERIALGPISTQRAAICTSVKVACMISYFKVSSCKWFHLFWSSGMSLAIHSGAELLFDFKDIL